MTFSKNENSVGQLKSRLAASGVVLSDCITTNANGARKMREDSRTATMPIVLRTTGRVFTDPSAFD